MYSTMSHLKTQLPTHQGRSQEGGGRGAPRWGFRAPRAEGPKAKTLAEATETLTEVTNFVRQPTKVK